MLAVIPCQLSLCLPHTWQGPCWPLGLVLSQDPECGLRKPGESPGIFVLVSPAMRMVLPDITSHT